MTTLFGTQFLKVANEANNRPSCPEEAPKWLCPENSKRANLVSRGTEIFTVVAGAGNTAAANPAIEQMLPWFVVINAGLEMYRCTARVKQITAKLENLPDTPENEARRKYLVFDRKQLKIQGCINFVKFSLAFVTLICPGIQVLGVFIALSYVIETGHAAYRAWGKYKMVWAEYIEACDDANVGAKSFRQIFGLMLLEAVRAAVAKLQFLGKSTTSELQEDDEGKKKLAEIEARLKIRLFKLLCDALIDLVIKVAAIGIILSALVFFPQIIPVVATVVAGATLALLGTMWLYHLVSYSSKYMFSQQQKKGANVEDNKESAKDPTAKKETKDAWTFSSCLTALFFRTKKQPEPSATPDPSDTQKSAHGLSPTSVNVAPATQG